MKATNKMTAFAKAASFLLIAASIIVGSTATAKDKLVKLKASQVMMCHVTEEGSYEIIVDQEEINSHLMLGDYLGPCTEDFPPVEEGGIAF